MYRYIESKDDFLMEVIKFSDCFSISEISRQKPYSDIMVSLQNGLKQSFYDGNYAYDILDSAILYLKKIDEASIFMDKEGDFFRSSHYQHLSYLLNFEANHLKWLSEDQEEEEEEDEDEWDDDNEEED